MQIIKDCIQGDEEWFRLRNASIGGSSITYILGRGKGRKDLLYKLAAETLTGQKEDSYSNANMQRGIEYEPMARDYYSIVTGHEVEQVALIKSDIPGIHVSPDGLVDDDGAIEIKTRLPHVFVEKKDSGKVEIGYVRQCQYTLWVAERKFCDFINYCPEMADPMTIQRLERDEAMIREMRIEVTLFLKELSSLVKRIS